jgi:[ribosomal protein S5]-alanine N-acetyltransferase
MESLGRFMRKSDRTDPLDSVEIFTARLRLTPVVEDDAEDIFREFTPAIATYMIPSPPDSILGTHAFVEQTKGRRVGDRELIVTLRTREEARFVGVVGLHALAVPKRAEIGLWLAADTHRKGLGFEGCSALLAWAEECFDLDVVEYPVDRRNIASRKLAEKLGGRITDERRQATQSGAVLDEVVYAIEIHGREKRAGDSTEQKKSGADA